MKRYEYIPHTADLAAKIYGKTIAELFQNAAYAMFSMIGNIRNLECEESVKVEVEALDEESLLIGWLNELLYKAYSKGILFCKFYIKTVADGKLTAEAEGARIKKKSKRIHKEIKAATYHDLEIKEKKSGYEVIVVFDV